MLDGLPFGDFLLMKKLGAGGMGELFLARARSEGGRPGLFAVKRLRPELAREVAFRREFLDEARVASHLSHPNIVELYDVGQAEDLLYIAMEYVRGVTLGELTAAARRHQSELPWEVAVKVCADLCRALAYAHGAVGLDGKPLQLVHRDVNPTNVMIGTDGMVKLIDFGLAKAALAWHRTQTGEVWANLEYVSPELLREEPLDARTDLYGVGISLYEALAGSPPFHGAEDPAHAVLSAAPAPLAARRRDLPRRVAEVVHSLLAKDPRQRTQTAAQLLAELEGCLAGVSVSPARISECVNGLIPRAMESDDRGQPREGTRPLGAGLQGAPSTEPRGFEVVRTRVHDRPLVTGDTLGPYIILRQLATGGMGQVWVARGTSLNRPVVLKTIPAHLASGEAHVEMFLNEARLAAQINHPNVVQILGLGKERGVYYLAMEYLEGHDLSEIREALEARRAAIAPELAAWIAAQCCAGLHFVHELKDLTGRNLDIVHRDVSLENVFASYSGQVRLLDFGIAKAASSANLTEPGKLKGKLGYLAPEQILARPLDRRADLWALGITLYQLVTGRRPFRSENPAALLHAIVNREPTLPTVARPGLPAPLERIILKALAKDPEQRYSTAAQMGSELEAFVEGSPHAAAAELARLMEALFPGDSAEPRPATVAGAPPLGSEDGVELATAVATRQFAAPVVAGGEAHSPEAPSSPGRETIVGRAPKKSRALRWVLTAGLALAMLIVFAGKALLAGADSSAPVPSGQPAPAAAAVIERPRARIEAAEPAGQPAASASTASEGRPVLEAAESTAGGEEPAGSTSPAGAALPGVGASAEGARGADPRHPTTRQPARVVPAAAGGLVLSANLPCDVELDGRSAGQTPLRLDALTAGKHRVALVPPQANGSARKELSVVVAPGKTVEEHVTFGTGRLLIRTTPWADVKVNGRSMGQTPMPPFSLLEGRYEILLENPELNVTKRLLTEVQAGRLKELTVRME